MAKILLVEDELSHQMIIKKALESQWEVEVCGSFAEAKERLKQDDYDLFLLDIMLGDGLGYELIHDIKLEERHRNKPIVFLTSNENVSMKVKCFSLGADDYVVKPCDPRELRARIEAKLARTGESGEVATEFKSNGFEFQFGEQKAYYESSDGRAELDLTPLEYKMLFVLVRRGERPSSREELLKRVWGESHHVQVRSVDTYVAALRKKLKGHGLAIKSVHGVGYCIQMPEQKTQAA